MQKTPCFDRVLLAKIQYMLFGSLMMLSVIWIRYEISGYGIVFNTHLLSKNRMLKHGIQVSKLITNQMDFDQKETSTHVLKISPTTRSQKCGKKKFNVSFLKVHKAGSTTVMNIFLRFAIKHELNIVLPRNSNTRLFNYLGFGVTLRRDKIVPLPTNESYNILCNHVVYSKKAFRDILQNDTIYIGIVRKPVSQFKSAALFYAFYRNLRNISTGIPEDKVVKEFLKEPSKVKIFTRFVHNPMSFDFGIPTHQFTNVSFIDSYIKELSQDYSLVLILEYLSESLVLTKRKLCWDTKDILYVPLNSLRRNLTFELDDDDMKRLKQWNSADVKLYEHFLTEFEDKVSAQEGDDFHEEVKHFKSIQKQVETFCKETVNKTSVLTIPSSTWDVGYDITHTDCLLMMERERPMVKRLIQNAWAKYNASTEKFRY